MLAENGTRKNFWYAS